MVKWSLNAYTRVSVNSENCMVLKWAVRDKGGAEFANEIRAERSSPRVGPSSTRSTSSTNRRELCRAIN